MTTRKRFALSLLLLSAPVLAACSGSSGGGGGATIVGIVQDLALDASGQTTVVTFPFSVPVTLTPGNFDADGGQLATAVTVVGPAVTITWDERVTPAHQVRALGVDGILEDLIAVTTSDPAAPSFVISAGTQTAGLGGDSFSAQFTGANLVTALAEDLANWNLSIAGRDLDLTGATFTFDELTQTLDVTLGPGANLHASFDLLPTGVTSVADVALSATVTGSATGDAVAPTLISAEQNLPADEFGLVVDFTFSESMDPIFNNLGNFDAGFPVFVTDVAQPTEDVLRVTFTHPVVPGLDPVDIDVVDAHGNSLTVSAVAIVAGSTVANDFAAGFPTLTTVPNSGGDTVVAQLVQALAPDTALDFTRWDLESPPGVDIDLTNASFAYDLLAKTLTITLLDDDLLTADGFTFQAAAGTPPIDVDGEDFTSTFTGTIAGDVDVPTVVSVTQNRVQDPTGRTFDVTLDEDVDVVQAEMTGNYFFSSGATVTSATLLAGLDTVRLVVDTETLPGEHTFDVQNLEDLAGNSMGFEAALTIGSTDGVAPLPGGLQVTADTGSENDQVRVQFTDNMVLVEVEEPLNWTLESPLGNALDTTLASVSYDDASRTAVLTFDGGDNINLQNREPFSLALATMRDLGGNLVDGTAVVGSVDAEDDFPRLESVWVEGGVPQNVHVRFDEPSALFDDALSAYVVRDALGLDVGGGPPSVVVDADQLGATLTFGLGVIAGTHTLDVSGITDLAGNQMFPVELFPITAADAMEPALDPGLQLYTVIAGEENDDLMILFDRAVSSWNLLDPANYDLTNGADTADFAQAHLSFDGDRTVTVVFDGPGGIDLDNGAYTLTVAGVLSVQGEAMTVSSFDTATPDPATDATPAALMAGETRIDAADPLNSVLIETDEATDETDAADTSNYAIGGVNPGSVTRLGFRTVRGTWAGGVSTGQLVDVTVADLAGNVALASEAIGAADAFGPTVIGVLGVVAPGVGGDRIEVTFSEPVVASSAVSPSNYSVASGGEVLSVGGMTFRYSSTNNAVTLYLPDSVDLQEADTVTVIVTGVRNHAGLVMNPPASVNGPIGGDGVAPGFRDAFANLRADSSGSVVDVRFTEDMAAGFVADPLNFASTGGQGVLTAELIRADSVRLTLSGPLLTGDMIEVTAAPDLAGNAAGTIQIEPVL